MSTATPRIPSSGKSTTERMFPTFTPAQLARIVTHGHRRATRGGEVLFEAGTPAAPFFVVISGQVAVDLDGRVVGSTIEEQTRATLGNCTDCLASAGCALGDVFKVNIYLADLGHWTRFNEIYQEAMPEPLPVRTAVQAILLPGYLVEIEMWAVKARD